jgi:hypothetical protein
VASVVIADSAIIRSVAAGSTSPVIAATHTEAGDMGPSGIDTSRFTAAVSVSAG